MEWAFWDELAIGQIVLDLMVLTQFVAAITRGERWAICKYMDQRMWRPEDAGGSWLYTLAHRTSSPEWVGWKRRETV